MLVFIMLWTTFLHTILNVPHRAHHIFLYVHSMLFMLWWEVMETCKSHHVWPCCYKSLTYLWLCLHDRQFSFYVQNGFLSQRYKIVSEALECTILMHWIIPVKTYSLYRTVPLALSIIYIDTHLLNVPFIIGEPGYYAEAYIYMRLHTNIGCRCL